MVALAQPLGISELFYLQGVKDRSAIPRHEVFAYHDLLKRGDGGRAFLQIMRGFELTEAKQRFLWEGLAERPYPAQIVWGGEDPALKRKHLITVGEVLAVPDPIVLPAKHFLQEEQAPAIAGAIGSIAERD